VILCLRIRLPLQVAFLELRSRLAASLEPGYNSPSSGRDSHLSSTRRRHPGGAATGFVQRPSIPPRRQPAASRSPLVIAAQYWAIVRLCLAQTALPAAAWPRFCSLSGPPWSDSLLAQEPGDARGRTPRTRAGRRSTGRERLRVAAMAPAEARGHKPDTGCPRPQGSATKRPSNAPLTDSACRRTCDSLTNTH
jgi:hypothetical protein